MRLQKQKTRQVKGKEYFRWVVVISPSLIQELGWKEGDQLTARRKKRRLVIEKS